MATSASCRDFVTDCERSVVVGGGEGVDEQLEQLALKHLFFRAQRLAHQLAHFGRFEQLEIRFLSSS